jgi:hypothetical protein
MIIEKRLGPAIMEVDYVAIRKVKNPYKTFEGTDERKDCHQVEGR